MFKAPQGRPKASARSSPSLTLPSSRHGSLPTPMTSLQQETMNGGLRLQLHHSIVTDFPSPLSQRPGLFNSRPALENCSKVSRAGAHVLSEPRHIPRPLCVQASSWGLNYIF